MNERVAVFGTFDSGAYRDILLGLIIERELRRRLPSVSLSFYAPLGWRRETAVKGGVIAEPFDAWSGDSDLLIVAGDVEVPRVEQAERVGTEAMLLVADLFPRDVLERRMRQMRAIGVYPIQGTFDDSNVTVEDVVAIAQAGGFEGSAVDFALIASAFAPNEQRARIVERFDHLANVAQRNAAQRSGGELADLQRREIASLTARNEALRLAHQTTRERMALEREIFAEAVNRFEEGDVNLAKLLHENAHYLRQWWDERHARSLAEQRIEEMRGENERNRVVMRTKLVSIALRVQAALARLRGK